MAITKTHTQITNKLGKRALKDGNWRIYTRIELQFCSFVVVLISFYFLTNKVAIIVAINLTGSISKAHKYSTNKYSSHGNVIETNE